MPKKYFLLGGIATVFLLIAGGVFFFLKNQQLGPSFQKELQIQISPLQEKSLSPSPSENIFSLPLILLSPQNQSLSKTNSLKVSGKTKPKATVVVNEKEITADKEGNFSLNITLDEGENLISILAYDEDGNYAEEELTVNYEPEGYL